MGSSIRRTDLLALSNLRNDGRKPDEIRRMRVQLGPVSNIGTDNSSETAGGSALVEMGLTCAMATVRGPIACIRRSDELPTQAIVDVIIKSVPFASSGGDRRITNPNSDRRFIEMSHLIKRSLEATLLLQLFPKSRIQVTIVILADDGGRLCCAINAASAALIDSGLPIKDVLCACSAGINISSDTTLIDLNRQEESSSHGSKSGAVHLPCAMLPQRGTLVLSQCEARISNFHTLDRVLEAAMAGCRVVFDIIQAAVRERASALMQLRNGQGTIIDSFAVA
jgi:exosome complex component RRP41